MKLLAIFENEKGYPYLGDRSSENDDFIELAHPLHKLIHAWSLDNIDVMKLPLNLHRDSKICLV